MQSPNGRVLDVVCGMRIDPATAAASVEYQGQVYHFCAPGCKVAFLQHPSRYLHISDGALHPPDELHV